MYALVALGLLLGGGTHPGLLNEFVVQAAAIGFIGYYLWFPLNDNVRALVIGLGVLLAFALLQAVAPMSRPAALGDVTAGAALVPHRANIALLSCLPALLAFYVTANGSRSERETIVGVMLAVVLLNVVLGIMQLTQGQTSFLRPYAETNRTEAVGLFANRNHFAALLYCGLVLAAGFFSLRFRRIDAATAKGQSASTLELVAAGLFVIVLLVGIMGSRSRAAVLLTMGALVAGAILVFVDVRRSGMNMQNWLAVAIAGGGALLAAQLGLGAIATRFEQDALADDRVAIAATTWDLVWQSLPFGLGLGSFESAYAAAEHRLDLAATYAHRAHNDVLELLLEFGVVSAALMLAFAVWYVRASFRVWRKLSQHAELGRAASIVILLLAGHSLFDYPLRTTAIQVVFAISCGLLLQVRNDNASEVAAANARAGALVELAMEPVVPVAPRQEWNGGVEWPKEWR
jgi:O-antigen ligase